MSTFFSASALAANARLRSIRRKPRVVFHESPSVPKWLRSSTDKVYSIEVILFRGGTQSARRAWEHWRRGWKGGSFAGFNYPSDFVPDLTGEDVSLADAAKEGVKSGLKMNNWMGTVW
jgi:hypothetical protein